MKMLFYVETNNKGQNLDFTWDNVNDMILFMVFNATFNNISVTVNSEINA